MKLESLFPVQKQVIPAILNSDRSQSIYPNDICITAPTGSGKTLTYVLPIIQRLRNRIEPCCRAIVLLPVSDLAEQVYNIFKSQLDSEENPLHLLDNVEQNHYKNDLKVMLLSTKTPFIKEQAQLVNQHYSKCLIDIIVTTPGRLVDHIQKTKGFNLNELRYLVLDECDRIMDQIKQNWLVVLNQAIFGLNLEQRDLLNQESLNVHNLFMNKKKLLPYQKLLLSATLTRNPEKLEQVNLFKPIYYTVAAEKLKSKSETELNNEDNDVKEKSIDSNEINENVQNEKVEENLKTKLENVDNGNDITIPDELNELFIEVAASQKPLLAIYLLKTLNYRRMLCFVKSIDTAKRLNKLFELNDIKSMEYSSSLHVARRKRIQTKFEKDEIDVLVCSDVMARGMDLENVDYVLLYDSVSFLNSYIHKVGRTARAGRSGTAISFLEHKEIFFFKKMISQIKSPDKNNASKPHKVKELKVQKSKIKPLLDSYNESLLKLKDSFKEAPKKETDQDTKDNNQENKNGKRKHMKERTGKFIKRFKQNKF